MEYSPNTEHLYSPSFVLNPKDTVSCGPPIVVRWVGGGGRRDAGRNDLPLDV
jgi:hypothetical protein